MTLETFLEKLEQTPRIWELRDKEGLIRCGDLMRPQCPMSHLTGDVSWCYDEAAEELGLERGLADKIAEAADRHSRHDPALRAKLLKACGLESK